MLRRVLFRLHWLFGLTAGAVLAVVGITGALMAYESELSRALNPGLLTLPAREGSPLTLPQAVVKARAAMPERAVTFVTMGTDVTQPWRVWYAWPPGQHGTGSRGELRLLDPMTGTLLPQPRGQAFFATVRLLHRTLLAGEFGKQLVGACVIGLVVMTLTGLYLRWPRRIADWRGWFTIRWSRSERIRWRDVHVVVGTITLPLYLLAALTGLYWTYDGYRAAAQRLAGQPVRVTAASALPRHTRHKSHEALDDAALTRVWNTFSSTATQVSTATVRVDAAHNGRAEIEWLPVDARHERAYNRTDIDITSGAVVRNERFVDKPALQRLLGSVLLLHTGRYFGPLGVVWMLLAASMLPAFAITGWWLYLDRRRRARASTRSRAASVSQ
ncbi:PepSY-associated TM helix domain-containing protein [Trinickia fusca]|uniref:PepSY domain-containing protein n=1 Tax=Trinickia fusca TaxID=2419777 RepID=A0A494XLH8_9BURK|nr:PepSY-associated TM helix domain-containing protein [Trinickia fusca]RKP48403.1 PepSY domain-containing protein [Trinickia fusca]